jgi:hypothetical protein
MIAALMNVIEVGLSSYPPSEIIDSWCHVGRDMQGRIDWCIDLNDQAYGFPSLKLQA